MAFSRILCHFQKFQSFIFSKENMSVKHFIQLSSAFLITKNAFKMRKVNLYTDKLYWLLEILYDWTVLFYFKQECST